MAGTRYLDLYYGPALTGGWLRLANRDDPSVDSLAAVPPRPIRLLGFADCGKWGGDIRFYLAGDVVRTVRSSGSTGPSRFRPMVLAIDVHEELYVAFHVEGDLDWCSVTLQYEQGEI